MHKGFLIWCYYCTYVLFWRRRRFCVWFRIGLWRRIRVRRRRGRWRALRSFIFVRSRNQVGSGGFLVGRGSLWLFFCHWRLVFTHEWIRRCYGFGWLKFSSNKFFHYRRCWIVTRLFNWRFFQILLAWSLQNGVLRSRRFCSWNCNRRLQLSARVIAA